MSVSKKLFSRKELLKLIFPLIVELALAHINTMAIFYNQSDEPNLTMRVNCIGRVTSDLSVFKDMGDSVTMTFELKKIKEAFMHKIEWKKEPSHPMRLF